MSVNTSINVLLAVMDYTLIILIFWLHGFLTDVDIGWNDRILRLKETLLVVFGASKIAGVCRQIYSVSDCIQIVMLDLFFIYVGLLVSRYLVYRDALKEKGESAK